LESGLGSRPHEFESRILRQQVGKDVSAPIGLRSVICLGVRQEPTHEAPSGTADGAFFWWETVWDLITVTGTWNRRWT